MTNQEFVTDIQSRLKKGEQSFSFKEADHHKRPILHLLMDAISDKYRLVGAVVQFAHATKTYYVIPVKSEKIYEPKNAEALRFCFNTEI
jgi:hypothetical protein